MLETREIDGLFIQVTDAMLTAANEQSIRLEQQTRKEKISKGTSVSFNAARV